MTSKFDEQKYNKLMELEKSHRLIIREKTKIKNKYFKKIKKAEKQIDENKRMMQNELDKILIKEKLITNEISSLKEYILCPDCLGEGLTTDNIACKTCSGRGYK